jgi:hypothetical protein
MKHEEASKIVAVLFASYPMSKFDRDNAKAFVDGISDLDAAACGAAVVRLVRTSKFLPSVAEIREAATAQRHGPRKTGAQAYEELLEAVQRHGGTPMIRWVKREMRMQSPWPPLEPDVAAAMRQTWGSWTDCCKAPDAQEMADRARFIAAYDGIAERERADLVSGQPLPPAQSAARLEPRNNRATMALVVPNGAAAAEKMARVASASDAAKAAAPADQPIPGPPVRREATRPPRKWTPEELEAELQKTGGTP